MSTSIKQAERRGYDGTVARIAGNICAGLAEHIDCDPQHMQAAAEWCVKMARLLVAETKRTEPPVEEMKA